MTRDKLCVVRVSESEKKRLEREAMARDVSLSDLVRGALGDYYGIASLKPFPFDLEPAYEEVPWHWRRLP